MYFLVTQGGVFNPGERFLAGGVDDVERTARLISNIDGPAGSFGFADGRAGKNMVSGFGVTGLEVFLDIAIDHIAIFGMRGHDATVLDQLAHQFIHLAIIDHQRTLVGHKYLE